jgi:hypothetical protein
MMRTRMRIMTQVSGGGAHLSPLNSDLVVLDTKNFSQRLALVKLLMSLRAGLHGNGVDAGNVCQIEQVLG